LARDGRVHVRERRLTCLAHGCGHLCPSGGRSQQFSGCCDFTFLFRLLLLALSSSFLLA
jgi:hypothetical protein